MSSNINYYIDPTTDTLITTDRNAYPSTKEAWSAHKQSLSQRKQYLVKTITQSLHELSTLDPRINNCITQLSQLH